VRKGYLPCTALCVLLKHEHFLGDAMYANAHTFVQNLWKSCGPWVACYFFSSRGLSEGHFDCCLWACTCDAAPQDHLWFRTVGIELSIAPFTYGNDRRWVSQTCLHGGSTRNEEMQFTENPVLKIAKLTMETTRKVLRTEATKSLSVVAPDLLHTCVAFAGIQRNIRGEYG